MKYLRKDFRDFQKFSHQGEGLEHEKSGEGHGMVVIGVRKEEHATFLLVQNFWKEKEFLEVDLQYVSCSGGSLCELQGEVDITVNVYSACWEHSHISTCESDPDRQAIRICQLQILK